MCTAARQPYTASDIRAALPDGITAALFLAAWILPGVLGAGWVNTFLATFLFEFLCIHAAGILLAAASGPPEQRLRRTLRTLLAGSGYLGLSVGFAHLFDAWWAVPALLWLLVSKLLPIWEARQTRAPPGPGPSETWALSVMLYIGAVLVAALLPWPQLGVTPEIVAAAGITGTGPLPENPQKALAGGLLYFGALSVIKLNWQRWSLTPVPPGRQRKASEHPTSSVARAHSQRMRKARKRPQQDPLKPAPAPSAPGSGYPPAPRG